MARLNTSELVKLMERTKNDCDKNCKQCEMFLPDIDKCFHEAQRRWQEWNVKNKNEFRKVLTGEKE